MQVQKDVPARLSEWAASIRHLMWKKLWNFETQIWLEMITSRDAKSACFKGSQTSCTEIVSCIFLPKFQGSVNGGFQTVVRVLWVSEIPLPPFYLNLTSFLPQFCLAKPVLPTQSLHKTDEKNSNKWATIAPALGHERAFYIRQSLLLVLIRCCWQLPIINLLLCIIVWLSSLLDCVLSSRLSVAMKRVHTNYCLLFGAFIMRDRWRMYLQCFARSPKSAQLSHDSVGVAKDFANALQH